MRTKFDEFYERIADVLYGNPVKERQKHVDSDQRVETVCRPEPASVFPSAEMYQEARKYF